jgi:hypothetical protein
LNLVNAGATNSIFHSPVTSPPPTADLARSIAGSASVLMQLPSLKSQNTSGTQPFLNTVTGMPQAATTNLPTITLGSMSNQAFINANSMLGINSSLSLQNSMAISPSLTNTEKLVFVDKNAGLFTSTKQTQIDYNESLEDDCVIDTDSEAN